VSAIRHCRGDAAKWLKGGKLDRKFEAEVASLDEYCLIGDLQQVVDLEPKTIRYYEQAGLITPRRLGRYRIYGKQDTERLKVIKFLRQFDLSVRMIRTLFKRHGAIGVNSLPAEAREAILQRLKERREEIEKLEKLL
jgi:DNA-binding transcriptional MerR regulator